MLRPRVIPTLLLKNNALVKTVKFKKPTYIGDPINAVKIFNDKEVDELILLDTTATNENREPDYKKIEEIVTEAFMPIGYGGGINKLEQIDILFKLGIEKIIINSAAYYEEELIQKAAKIYGSQSIVIAIDVKKGFFSYYIYSDSGKVKQKVSIEDHLIKVEKLGAGEIYLNSIDKDGTMSGYDISLIQLICPLVGIPVIACGGAGNVNHFMDAIKAGASAVSAGALFVFQGVHRAVLISYPSYEDLKNKLN